MLGLLTCFVCAKEGRLRGWTSFEEAFRRKGAIFSSTMGRNAGIQLHRNLTGSTLKIQLLWDE